MEQAKRRIRKIKFNSIKNNEVMEVHSDLALRYARILEDNYEIVRYQCDVSLNASKYKFIDSIGIKKSYFENDWISHFKIWWKNGTVSVREIVMQHDINRPSTIQKLELSRRYWEQEGITDWKIVLA